MSDVPKTMRSLRQAVPGGPLEVKTIEVPNPGPGEVLVRIAASPINPSDLAMLQGAYGIAFDYPMTPGLEGSGEVVAVGSGLMPWFLRGKRVACAAGSQGLWAEYAAVPATQCLPLPDGVGLGMGAMAVVNPLTAIAFVEIARQMRQGAIVSTAAAGQLGSMIRRAAHARSIDVINIVRGEAQMAAMAAENARALDMTSPGFDADLKAMAKQLRSRLALDAVAGDMTHRLVEAMPSRSTVLVYGGLSEAPSHAHPGTLIFREATVRGFWLTKWLARKSLPQMVMMSRKVMHALDGGFAESRVAQVVRLEAAAAAPAAYAADMSAGKVLIAPDGPDGLGLASS